jgi:hypothetical protein
VTRRLPVLLLVASLLGTAAAHDRTASYSTWELGGRGARVTVRLSALDVSRFPWSRGRARERELLAYLTAHLRLLAGAVPCAVTDGPRRLDVDPAWVAAEWTVACAGSGALAIRSDLLLDLAPAHLHFARLVRPGTPVQDRVLTEAERAWTIETASMPAEGWVALGIEHILTGWDHLAFLAALLLLGGTLGEVARVVTGFTAAHSLTLALAALGRVRPEAAPVEALIGLSVALVAAENVWLVGTRGRALPAVVSGSLALLAAGAAAGLGCVPATTLAGLALFTGCYFGLLRRFDRPESLRWALAFLFGLLHGFGFAGVLAEARLDSGRMLGALLGFNLGVEAGQLAVVALVWPLLRAAVRRRLAVVDFGSAVVAGLGLFWFVSRAY